MAKLHLRRALAILLLSVLFGAVLVAQSPPASAQQCNNGYQYDHSTGMCVKWGSSTTYHCPAGYTQWSAGSSTCYKIVNSYTCPAGYTPWGMYYGNYLCYRWNGYQYDFAYASTTSSYQWATATLHTSFYIVDSYYPGPSTNVVNLVGETSTLTTTGTGDRDPWYSFHKSTVPNSTLNLYASVNGTRMRLTQRAGSGSTANECDDWDFGGVGGWLPNGSYTVNQVDNNFDSQGIVLGTVWRLNDAWCSNPNYSNFDGYRDYLYIHSQGNDGGSWNTNNFYSHGCIKVSQLGREDIKSLLAVAYNGRGGSLHVTGP